jgi:pimeloyl-ACP methyl ester carboxylesterase
MKENIIISTFNSWIYILESIYHYFFSKKWTDKKISKYLKKKYNKDDVVVVALHGLFEYYWQFFPKYIRYFDERKKSFIPIGYNYHQADSDSVEEIKNKIEEVHKKTGAKIVILGSSLGAMIAIKYVLKYNPKFVKEVIPLAGMYDWVKGITFWGYWIVKTPREEFEYYINKLKKEKIPKVKLAIYAKKDVFVYPNKARILPTVKNVGFPSGHFSLTFSKEVIEFVYSHIHS